MKVTLTTMSGNTKSINLMTKQEVYDFIEVFQSTLLPNQRVKITCDLLSIDGYLQGVSRQTWHSPTKQIWQGVALPYFTKGVLPYVKKVALVYFLLLALVQITMVACQQCAHYCFSIYFFIICIIHKYKIFRFLLFWFLQNFSDFVYNRRYGNIRKL